MSFAEYVVDPVFTPAVRHGGRKVWRFGVMWAVLKRWPGDTQNYLAAKRRDASMDGKDIFLCDGLVARSFSVGKYRVRWFSRRGLRFVEFTVDSFRRLALVYHDPAITSQWPGTGRSDRLQAYYDKWFGYTWRAGIDPDGGDPTNNLHGFLDGRVDIGDRTMRTGTDRRSGLQGPPS